MRALIVIVLVLATGLSAWACPPDSLKSYLPIWDDDTTNWDDLWYGPITAPAIANTPDSLVIFYVDTVAWKIDYKSECWDKNYGVKWGFPPGMLDCNVKHPKTIAYWIPIVETTVVATYPISSKAKRDRWEWRIK